MAPHVVAKQIIDSCISALRSTPNARAQLVRILSFGSAMIGAKVLSVITQVFLGRRLGPSAYGELSIVLLLASYLYIPISNGWGLAYVRSVARVTDATEKRILLSSTLLLSVIASVLTVTLLLLTLPDFLALIQLPPELSTLTIVMTLGTAWWFLTKFVAQSRQAWTHYTSIELSWASLILGLILVAHWTDLLTLQSALIVFVIGYFISGLIELRPIAAALRFPPRAAPTAAIAKHGLLLALNAATGAVAFSIDRLLIQTKLGAHDLGIYQAHFVSTYGVISSLTAIAVTYLFPLLCKQEQGANPSWLTAIIVAGYPVVLVTSIIVGSVILFSYAYPISWKLFFLLCFFTALHFHSQVKSWWLASRGVGSTAHAVIAQVIFLVFNVATLLFTVRTIGILSGGYALIAGSIAALLYMMVSSSRRHDHERAL